MLFRNKTHTAAELNCIISIRDAVLPAPVKCEPFTIFFDCEKLNAARDLYGYDLYKKCLEIVLNEQIKREEAGI